jgi:hypothetical protein
MLVWSELYFEADDAESGAHPTDWLGDTIIIGVLFVVGAMLDRAEASTRGV